MCFLPTNSCYSRLGRNLHGSYSCMTASYSFLAISVCVSSKWMCCTASLLQSTNKPFPMHVACHIHQMHLCSICKKNSRFGPSDGKSSTKLPQKGSSAGKEPHLWLTTHNLHPKPVYPSRLYVAGEKQRLSVGCKPPARGAIGSIQRPARYLQQREGGGQQ